MKYYIILLSALLMFFSCTTKEEQVKDFVEKNVIQQAEDHLICQAIMKYIKNDAQKVFQNKIKYYAENPFYDYSYFEKELGRPFMALASDGIMKKFDERWKESFQIYTMLSNEENIEYGMHQIDSTLKFRDLIKETSYYTIDEIADIYFKPNHLKFKEITPDLYSKIYRSMLCLGAKTYKYDVVDEIRIKEKEENKWTVDLVYHSGFCIPLEVGLNKDIGFFVSEAPWLPEAWETVDDLGQDHKQSDDTGDDSFFCQQIDKWNDMYHHRRFENSSNNPYAETVMFYGKRMTGKEVVKMNQDFLRNNPDFRQECYNIKVIKLSDSRVRCNFDKRVTINGKTKEYPSYLYFTKESGNNWLIDEESDEITDRNLRK